MSAAAGRFPSRSRAPLVVAGAAALLFSAVLGTAILGALIVAGQTEPTGQAPPCATRSGAAGRIPLALPGDGALVGATEYGGPGDPSSGTVGASGTSLPAHPDSYAELGGATVQTATAMGGLAFMTPLRITWQSRSAIAYKRDIGLGGGPIDGRPRVIDLWWQLAGALRIPYDRGLWSGAVRVARPPAIGSGDALGQSAASLAPVAEPARADASGTGCSPPAASLGLPLTPGSRARLLDDGSAAAPVDAPSSVRGIIAAGNQIAGRPYIYGAGHGLPLDELAAAYDCSSSVEHLLYGGGLLPVGYGAASSALAAWGQAGPGRWVTLYANPDHVFMYVAGLRWDTWDAAGPGDGSAGIGWHPLVRDAAGFTARHPEGL